MKELFKGYTQHLISNKIDDETPGAILRMEMIPGLYVMKQLQQEGYVLPVCKYINNLRSVVAGSFPVNTPGICTHPKFDYAYFEDNKTCVQNVELLPNEIKGGVVCINNLMRTRTIPRYADITSGNFNELVADGSIAVHDTLVNDEIHGYVLIVYKTCILKCEGYSYVFTLVSKEGVNTDFIAEIK